jgi:hypothetical protein
MGASGYECAIPDPHCTKIVSSTVFTAAICSPGSLTTYTTVSLPHTVVPWTTTYPIGSPVLGYSVVSKYNVQAAMIRLVYQSTDVKFIKESIPGMVNITPAGINPATNTASAPGNNSDPTREQPQQGLSDATKIGVAVGVALGVVIIILSTVLIVFLRRHNKRSEILLEEDDQEPQQQLQDTQLPEEEALPREIFELDHENGLHEMFVKQFTTPELEGTRGGHEMMASLGGQELLGSLGGHELDVKDEKRKMSF